MIKIISDPKFFPSILILLDLCAAVRYIPTGDFKRAVYWFAAAVLTWSVTW